MQLSTRSSVVHLEGLVKIIMMGSADLLPNRQAMKKERFIPQRTRDGAEVIAQKACDAKPYLPPRTPFGMT